MQYRRPCFDSWVGKIPWRRDVLPSPVFMGFPGVSESKESTCNVGDLGSIPGLGRSLGGRHSNPLHYSCLENPHGQRSLVGYSPWGHKESEQWATQHSTTTVKNMQLWSQPVKAVIFKLEIQYRIFIIIKLLFCNTTLLPNKKSRECSAYSS